MNAVAVRSLALPSSRAPCAAPRVRFRALALLLLLAPGGTVRAESSRSVRVLGSASLSASISPAANGTAAPGDGAMLLRIEGRLSDDAGQGVPTSPVTLTLSPASARPPKNCPGHGSVTRGEARPPQLTTDAEGRFCFLLAQAALPGARLSFSDAAGYLGTATLDLPDQPTSVTTQLSFGALPNELSLDTPVHEIEVSATLPTVGSPPGGELPIELGIASPHGGVEVVASSFIRIGERARFEVRSSALGKPGAAVLVARLSGTPATEARQRITKTAEVTLRAAFATVSARADEAVEVPLFVRWQRGDVDAGTVEAYVDGRASGAAAVEKGAAGLVVRAPSTEQASGEAPSPVARTRSAEVELRFVPNAPWWRSGAPARLTIELLPPSPWSKWPWIVAALTLFGWVAMIWKRPPRRARTLTPVALEPPGHESLLVQDAAGTTLRGQILDAHTSEPVAQAFVRVTEAAVERVQELAGLPCDGEGRFELALGEGMSPRTLHVSAPGYGELSRPLPARGRVVIHLVTLRRSVLEQLASWARRKGPPWSAGGVPTPGQVAETARARSEARVEHWAEDVEAAAFGPEEPTARTERALRDAEPP